MRIGLLLAIPLLLSPAQLKAAERISARLVRVVDGDTIRVDLDLGADVILKNQAVRILGIDAPEMHGPERERGRAAKAAAEKFLAGKKLEVELHDKDKYGRWLGDVFTDGEPRTMQSMPPEKAAGPTEQVRGENLALWMLKNGHARPYQIGRPKIVKNKA